MRKIFGFMQAAGIILAIAVAGGMDADLMPMLQSAALLAGACTLLLCGSLLQRGRERRE